MKKVVLIAVFCLIAPAVTPALAGLFKDGVDTADLAAIPEESLQSLSPTEFAVFLADVKLQAAKKEERRAADEIDAAQRKLDTQDLDRKAARAEVKAAQSNQDEERLRAGLAQVSLAERDLETARLLRKWKSLEKDARAAEVDAAKAGVALAEAQRDAARVQLMINERVAAAGRHDLADYERDVAKRRREVEAADRKAADKSVKAAQLRAEWEGRAADPEPVTEQTP